MTHHHDHENLLGIIIGGAMGLIKGFFGIVGAITISNIIETSVLAAIGAFVGFLVTTVSKWAFNKIRKKA